MTEARPFHLYVVEDDTAMRDMLAAYLERQGLAVTAMPSAEELLRRIDRLRPDLVVLDVNLPGMSGLQACQKLRAAGDRLPIILLTAQSDEVDRVLGLEMGADDYLGKPFSARELLARIRAVLRRAGQPLSRERLLAATHQRSDVVAERTIDVAVMRLRKIVEPDPAMPRFIQTVRGHGYMFVPGGQG